MNIKTLNQMIDLPENHQSFITPDWRAPHNVRALITTRQGGVSTGVFGSLNVGAHVGDRPEAVAQNRAIVQQQVSVPIVYLNQVHGTCVVQAVDAAVQLLNADAVVDRTGTVACGVMTADCLPVLLCDRVGSVVAAAHAGWRGLADGVLQNTIAALNVPAVEIMAYLGPAIGADAFEVGEDVFNIFVSHNPAAEQAFKPLGDGKYLADIYLLARQILQREGVTQIFGGEHCTVLERETFFSYRRDGQTGRMLSVIWLESGVE